MWWPSKRRVEALEAKLRELEEGTLPPREVVVDVEGLREEVRTQGEAQREALGAVAIALAPEQPEGPALAVVLRSEWREGLRQLWHIGLRGLLEWFGRLLVYHWKWSLGVLGAVIALGIPAYLQFEGNQFQREANTLQKEANVLSRETLLSLSKQIESQEADTEIVRRAQLLNTIYELSDCDLADEQRKHAEKAEALRLKAEEAEEGPSKNRALKRVALFEAEKLEFCPPKAAVRLRQEAVLALAKLDGEDLSLFEANLYGAYLRSSNLYDVNFRKADLRSAYLYNANLRSADFRNADLRSADLSNADLYGANFYGTSLYGANLSGADLSFIISLETDQLGVACGDSKTRIPSVRERPAHWLTRPSRFDDPIGAGCPGWVNPPKEPEK